MPYLLLTVGLFLFIFSVFMLLLPSFTHFDFIAVEWLNQHRTTNLNIIAKILSAIGGMPFVLFLTSLWCLHQAWYKQYMQVAFIGLGLIGSIVTVWLIKYLIARPRPPEMYQLVHSYGASFPSAHSTYAAALGCLAIFLSLKHPEKRLIWICACAWIILMGSSRVYLGVHFPSDVLAGWGISFIWIALLYLVCVKFSKSKKLILDNNLT